MANGHVRNRSRNTAGGTAAVIVMRLADAFRDGSRAERACYLVAATLFLGGVLHFGVLVVTGGSWSGPVSWRKPMTFGFSFGLTLATITWVLSLVPLRSRTRSGILLGFAPACVVEVAVITTQAWRGLPSHFAPPGAAGGVTGPLAALGAVTIILTMLTATIVTWRGSADVPPSMRLALRAGFLALMVALALGAFMLAYGMVLARGQGDARGAFAFTAGIKPGHAATMHGVLVLPALAWLLRFAPCAEEVRLLLVRIACGGYLAFAGVVVVESLAGIDPLAVAVAPVPATGLLLAGALLLLGAGVAALRLLLVSGPGGRAASGDRTE